MIVIMSLMTRILAVSTEDFYSEWCNPFETAHINLDGFSTEITEYFSMNFMQPFLYIPVVEHFGIQLVLKL